MFKGAAFDLDGVITDTAEFHYLAWKKLGEKLEISFDREFNERLKGISRDESLELILSLDNKQNDFSPKEKQELMTSKNNLYIELIQNINKDNILPGIFELLNDFKFHNIKMAIASASKNAPMILEKLEIIDFFDIVIDPTTLENGKPAPDIFIKATKELQLLPSEMIGLEDSQAGINSINDANLFSIGVGKLVDVNYLVNDTAELTYKKIKNAFNK